MRFANYPGGILSFNGAISLDEITIWNTALSQTQVASNLFTPLTGNEANLVALYRCNEGGGTLVADSAPLGGNNNGTWVGTPAFVPDPQRPLAPDEFTMPEYNFSLYFGPTLKTMEAAADRGGEFRAVLAGLARSWSRIDGNGPVAIPATYLASIGARIAA